MKLEKLSELVAEQYGKKDPNRAEWSDWLYENHVLWVAHKTDEYCKRFGANTDIAVAATLIHDIADVDMPRASSNHEVESLNIGRNLCLEAGYTGDEIDIIIDDIALKHSCHDSNVPESIEGKLMAAADAAAHLQTGFILFAFTQTPVDDIDSRNDWALKKVERDFKEKIFHEEIRKELLPYYEAWKLILS